MQQSDVVLVLTTLPDAEQASAVAGKLIELGLAACVNVEAPVRSVYRWQGVVEQADEIPLRIKTTRRRQAELLELLAAIHPYELPEVIVVPVVGGHAPYLEWVREVTSAPAS
jgi:periplasmic divalent cation tolerance protein